jgi:hypothetical protein
VQKASICIAAFNEYVAKMNYKSLSAELVVAIRGHRSQGQVNQKLGFSYNRAHRWETGKVPIKWREFVSLCHVCRAPLVKALRESFSYFESVEKSEALVRHFVGTNQLTTVSQAIGVSRFTLSRWLTGQTEPNLWQILALIYFASVDFLRFLEIITASADLPTLREQFRLDRIQLDMFHKYPWLSVLLSAIDLEEYRLNPSEEWLAQKAKLPLESVKNAISDLSSAGLLLRKDGVWETALKRTALRGSLEGRKRISEYVLSQTLAASRTGFGNPMMRFSWKIFSINHDRYELILQKYTEFFNELGTIIDAGQKGADKIYLFSVGLIDYDQLPPAS